MPQPNHPIDPIDLLVRALAATERLVAGVGDDEWSNATPCTEWTVRALVNHVVGGHQMVAGILAGTPAPSLEEMLRRRAADHLGADPLAAYRAASAELVTAAQLPGVLEKMVEMPVGVVTGLIAVHLRITESLVHGWDLARATGQRPEFPDDIAEAELEFSEAQLPAVPAGRRPFAPPQPAPREAPAIDRLVALLGRPLAASTTPPAHSA